MEAFSLVSKSEDFDLVITDWYMPKLNGIEFIKLLEDWEYKLPIIICTFENEINKVKQAMNLPIVDYLLKPYTLNSLRKKVTNITMPYN